MAGGGWTYMLKALEPNYSYVNWGLPGISVHQGTNTRQQQQC